MIRSSPVVTNFFSNSWAKLNMKLSIRDLFLPGNTQRTQSNRTRAPSKTTITSLTTGKLRRTIEVAAINSALSGATQSSLSMNHWTINIRESTVIKPNLSSRSRTLRINYYRIIHWQPTIKMHWSKVAVYHSKSIQMAETDSTADCSPTKAGGTLVATDRIPPK